MNKKKLKAEGKEDVVIKYETGLCTKCALPIIMSDFRDRKSFVEYGVNGICQLCQDLKS